MILTPEQKAILKSSGNIKINAVAGSGKTTTLLEYAKTRNPGDRILYLVFNRSAKLEAERKFLSLLNVRVDTAHSLAFHFVVKGNNYKLKEYGYKVHELVELLNIEERPDKHHKYIIANHVLKFATYFCNSDKQRVAELNYSEVVNDYRAKGFVQSNYLEIEKYTRKFLKMMDRCEADIMHDFYLKKFQLEKPKLNYDYILFDEAQDASPAMLDIVLNQNATKVIVGDT